MNYLSTLAQELLSHVTANKDILHVFCPCSIGDILINGGLCHALLKKKRKKACILIEHDKYANSGAINFVGVMEIRYIPLHLAVLMQEYILATREYETDNFIYGHFRLGDNGSIINHDLSFVNRYKENVFGLPLDTEFIPPIIEPPTNYQKQRLHENYVLDKERTIILAPYSVSGIKDFEEAFWPKLVSELAKRNKDYVFYTNIANANEKVIPGTAPIMTTFPELVYLAEKVNCFIGRRSGIFDLLAFTSAKLLYIIMSLSWWHYDLRLNYNHTNSKAFCLLSNDEMAQLQTFMQQNNLPSIDNVTFFYGCLSGKDIAWNTDSLIEKIISAVD